MNTTGPAAAPGPPLGALDPAARSPFGPSSVLRRVVAEPVVALMIQRALVMDVAHPKVAAGVEDHSTFRTHPWRRAWVTVDAGLRLVFGPTPMARAAARQIYDTHDHIHGSLTAGDVPGDGDEVYNAHDATLLAWVWATLVDASEVAYTRYIGGLSPADADAFYAEMVAFARFVGIPADLLPADRRAFAAYLDEMIGGGLLGTTEPSRSLARQILWFEHRSVPDPIVRIGRVLAVNTLDPRLCDALDLRLDAGDERFGRRLDQALATYYPRLPRARAGLPTLYVLARRPTVGLAVRARAARARAARTVRT